MRIVACVVAVKNNAINTYYKQKRMLDPAASVSSEHDTRYEKCIPSPSLSLSPFLQTNVEVASQQDVYLAFQKRCVAGRPDRGRAGTKSDYLLS